MNPAPLFLGELVSGGRRVGEELVDDVERDLRTVDDRSTSLAALAGRRVSPVVDAARERATPLLERLPFVRRWIS